MKVLHLDIETMPSLMWGFGLFDQNFSLAQVKEPGWVACFSAKWHGAGKVMFHSEYHEGGRAAMLQRAFDLLEECDGLVTFNGDQFDIKHLNWEFQQHGLGVPAPYASIDLRKTVRSRFRPMSGKLQHIVQQLEIGTKVDHDGFPLWRGWMERDPKHVRLMEKYAKRDSALLEPLYEALLPWIHNHPNVNLFSDTDGPEACNRCGSSDLEKRGFSYTSTAKRQRYRCNGCGGWSASGKAVKRVDLRGTK
jgi:hypothetical protein